MARPQLQNLISQEVSRKEFLAIAGLAVASIFGMGGILKLLTGKSLSASTKSFEGYGRDGYGK